MHAGKKLRWHLRARADELDNYKKLAHIEDLVDAATTSDDADKSKPHPDIFQAALDRLAGVAATEAIAIGDTPYDAEAAGKAGLRSDRRAMRRFSGAAASSRGMRRDLSRPR